jgi:hypothetical protein
LHYEYQQKWLDLGYRADMGSCRVCLPPPGEFIRVYRFMSADHAIASIALGRLKVSRVSELNDPYEMLPYKRTGELTSALPVLKQFVDENFRFLCFSSDWRSPLLWGHYADRHRGVCLGFDMLREGIKRVDYRPERLEISGTLNEMSTERKQEFAQELTRIKHEDWRYEEEVRALIALEKTRQESNLRFYPLDNNLRLSEVITGLECAIAVDELRTFVQSKYSDAIVFGTRPAEKWFYIVPRESTLPDD